MVNKNAKFMREFREFAKAISPEDHVESNDVRSQVSIKISTNGTVQLYYPGISGVAAVYGSSKSASIKWQDSYHVGAVKDYIARELRNNRIVRESETSANRRMEELAARMFRDSYPSAPTPLSEIPVGTGGTVTFERPIRRGDTITVNVPSRWEPVSEAFTSTVMQQTNLRSDPVQLPDPIPGYYSRLVESNLNNWFRNAQTGESE